MNNANVTKPRGTIIKVPDASPGLLSLNGRQMQFTVDGVWKSPVAPAANQTVDVEFDGSGVLAAMTVVDSHLLAKERFNQLGGVAQERGKEAANIVLKAIKALAARMGTVPLAAAAAFWIAWFFFPAANIGGEGMGGSVSLTFWNLLGVNFNNLETILRGGSDHGLFAFLGLIAIAAPFAAPFLRSVPWSQHLNAAPLSYLVIAFIVITFDENKLFGEFSKNGIPSPFSWAWLTILFLGIAALVLGYGALKKPAEA
jgi:hypothetical protein